LSKVEGREKREELRGEVVRRIIEMNVKVASDEFMRDGSSERKSVHSFNKYFVKYCIYIRTSTIIVIGRTNIYATVE